MVASEMVRRTFLGAAGAAAVAATGKALAADAEGKAIKIVAVSCSPRKGKTTVEALKICLDAAKAVSPRIEVEMIELAGQSIDGAIAAGVAPAPGAKDDFPAVAEKLSDPRVGGIIVGSPVYFGMMSALCKAFIDRCMAFRKGFALHDRVLGVVAVGGARNGGQELTIQGIQSCLMCQEIIVVGDGRPTAHRGATLWNQGDSIAADEFGIGTAKNLGRRVAEVALRLAGGA